MSSRFIVVLTVVLLTLSSAHASQEASNRDMSWTIGSFNKESPSPSSDVTGSSLPVRYLQVEASVESKIDLRNHESISEVHPGADTSLSFLSSQELAISRHSQSKVEETQVEEAAPLLLHHALPSREARLAKEDKTEADAADTSGYWNSMANESVIVIQSPSFDNETFAATFVCKFLDTPVDSLTITINVSDSNYRVLFPSCLSAAESVRKELVVKTIGAGRIIIDSFDVFPSSLRNLSLSGVLFAPNFTRVPSASGFTIDATRGAVFNWPSVWSSLSNLQAFSIISPLGTAYGSLPAALPTNLFEFTLKNMRGITGSIPQDLLGNFYHVLELPIPFSFVLVLEQLGISGTIPELFQPFFLLPDIYDTRDSSFVFRCNDNFLVGSIPSFPLGGNRIPYASVEIDMSENALNGTLRSPLLPTTSMLSNAKRFSFDVADNTFTGFLPSSLIDPAQVIHLTEVSLDITGNEFEGTIPPSLISCFTWNTSTPVVLTLSLGSNKLSGEIPWNLLTSSFLAGDSPTISITLNVAGNALNGTIPHNLFYYESEVDKRTHLNRLINGDSSSTLASNPSNIASSASSTLVSSNPSSTTSSPLTSSSPAPSTSSTLASTLVSSNPSSTTPSSITQRSSGAITSFLIKRLLFSASRNQLSGSIPPELLAFSQPVQLTSTDRNQSFVIDLSSNQLNGTIPTDLFDTVADDARNTMSLYASSNRLTGPIPRLCKTTTPLFVLALQSNSLSGPIPSEWQTCSLDMVFLYDNPLISGALPPNLFGPSSTIKTFSASNTGLLGIMPSVNARVSTLALANTNINFCAFKSTNSPPPVAHTITSCTLDNTTACGCAEGYDGCTTTCAPSSLSTCTSSPPTPEFTCIDGIWTAPSTTVPTLTIPSSSGHILITGNVSSSSIVFQGVIGTTITINGCANNLTTIVIQLSQEEILKIDKSGSKTFTLLTQTNAPSSCAGLGNVAVNTRTDKGCRTATSRKVVSDDGKSLGAIISVDSSGCNRWWIILVSVVVVVVILGAAAIAVGVTLWKRHIELKQMRSLKAGVS